MSKSINEYNAIPMVLLLQMYDPKCYCAGHGCDNCDIDKHIEYLIATQY